MSKLDADLRSLGVCKFHDSFQRRNLAVSPDALFAGFVEYYSSRYLLTHRVFGGYTPFCDDGGSLHADCTGTSRRESLHTENIKSLGSKLHSLNTHPDMH